MSIVIKDEETPEALGLRSPVSNPFTFPPEPPSASADVVVPEEDDALSSGSESTSDSEMEETEYKPSGHGGKFKPPICCRVSHVAASEEQGHSFNE